MTDKIELSQDFKNFMIGLKAWVDAGCPDCDQQGLGEGLGFLRNDSICFQIGNWTLDDDVYKRVGTELEELFIDQFGGHQDYPFNQERGSYNIEMEQKTHYQNAQRVKWINDTVASFGEK